MTSTNARQRAPSIRALLVAALLVRVVLLVWAEWQDRHWAVHYTDIDYDVVLDGARAIAAGGSPYDRSTFRYTPFLAWLALPSVWVHGSLLKALYCLADLGAAW